MARKSNISNGIKLGLSAAAVGLGGLLLIEGTEKKEIQVSYENIQYYQNNFPHKVCLYTEKWELVRPSFDPQEYFLPPGNIYISAYQVTISEEGLEEKFIHGQAHPSQDIVASTTVSTGYLEGSQLTPSNVAHAKLTVKDALSRGKQMKLHALPLIEDQCPKIEKT